MIKVLYLKNRIEESFKRYRVGIVSVYCGRLTKLEIERLSKWFIVEREPLGYVKFTRKEDSK